MTLPTEVAQSIPANSRRRSCDAMLNGPESDVRSRYAEQHFESRYRFPVDVASGVRGGGGGPHWAAFAGYGKRAKIVFRKAHVSIQIVSFICVCVQ